MPPPHSVRKRKFCRTLLGFQSPPSDEASEVGGNEVTISFHLGFDVTCQDIAWAKMESAKKNTFLCFLLSTILVYTCEVAFVATPVISMCLVYKLSHGFFSLRHSTNPISQVGSRQIGKQQKVLLVCPRDPQFQKIDEYMKPEPRSF